MAFTSAIVGNTIMGNKRVAWGTWTTDAASGDIDTGLRVVEMMLLQTSGAAVSADQSAVNETLPFGTGSAVSIACTAGADGFWLAIGL